MTRSVEESSSEEDSEDKGDVESSIVPSFSFVPDAHANRWCIKEMDEIFREGIQPKEGSKPTHSIYKEPWVILDGRSRVPGLQDIMIYYELMCLIESL